MYLLSITTIISQVSDFLIEYGYTGMGISAFLAGSFIPFSSEFILAALHESGLQWWPLVVFATIGNVLGGIFNYCVGRMCNEGWVYRLFRIKEEKLESSKEKVRRHGAWMGLLSWLPVLGSAITIALGILRVHCGKSILTMTVSKFLRYLALGYILHIV